MSEKTRKASLNDYMKAGAKMKMIEDLIWTLVNEDMSKILDGRTVSGAEKSFEKVLVHVKSDAEDNMFEAYEQLGHDYINVFYGSIWPKWTYGHGDEDYGVGEEIRDIALDIITSIVGKEYGTAAFDEMKERWERKNG